MDIEEMRKGVHEIICGQELVHHWVCRRKIDRILSYLAEKGACFPVEGELPQVSEDARNDRKWVAAFVCGEMEMLKANYKKVITLKEMLGGD